MKTIARTRFGERIFHKSIVTPVKKFWLDLTAIALFTFFSGGILPAQENSDDTQTNEPAWNAPMVVIGKDAELKKGESVEAVVVIGGSAKIHGKVQNAAVVRKTIPNRLNLPRRII